MRVRDPQGRFWRVSRRWTPWRRRTRLPSAGHLPVFRADGNDTASALVLLVVGVPLLVVTAVALAELALLLLLLPVLALARIILGRHWVVEVRSGMRAVWETEVGTWPQTRAAINSMASGLESGIYPWEEQPGRALADDVDGLARGGRHRPGVADADVPRA